MGVCCAWADKTDHGSGRQSPMIQLGGGVQFKGALFMLDAPILRFGLISALS